MDHSMYAKGEKEITVASVFENGTHLKDAYSGKSAKVIGGKVIINSKFEVVLLESEIK